MKFNEYLEKKEQSHIVKDVNHREKDVDNKDEKEEVKEPDKDKKTVSSSSLCPKCRRAKDHCRCDN